MAKFRYQLDRDIPSADTSPVVTPPTVDFSFQQLPEFPLVVFFTSLHTGIVTSFLWAFGDELASTSTNQDTNFTYTELQPEETKLFTVRLTINAGPFAEKVVSVTNSELAAPTQLLALRLTIDESLNMTTQQALNMGII